MTLLLWTLLLACFLCSAFFAASEAALTALSPLRMKRLMITRPELGAAFGEWLTYPHRFFTLLLVGNNLVNTAISSIAAVLALPLAARAAPWIFDAALTLTVTVALLILGEITPKIVARAYREAVSVAVLPFLRRLLHAARFFLAPLIWLLDKAGLGGLGKRRGDLGTLSLEELRHIIGESEASGQMAPLEGEMLRRALALPERNAERVMIPLEQVDAVPLEALEKRGIDDFIDRMVETGRTRVPVTFGGEFLGYMRPLEFLKQGPIVSLQQLKPLVQKALAVPPEKSALELLEEFQNTGIPMAFVRDGAGPVRGIITLEDVLEEIVGEILDEYDLEMGNG